MLEKTEGIVLSSLRYGDSSLITKILTKKHGLLSFMIKGARSSKSGKGNLLQPLTILDLDIYFREQKNLLSLKEFNPQLIFNTLHFDFSRKSIGIFIAEMLLKCCPERQCIEDIYELAKNSLLDLEHNETLNPFYPIHFIFELSMLMGFFPNISEGDYFDLQAGTFTHEPNFTMPLLLKEETIILKRGISQYIEGSQVEQIQLNGKERKVLLDKLLVYFQLHVPNFKMPTSPDILREVLSGI